MSPNASEVKKSLKTPSFRGVRAGSWTQGTRSLSPARPLEEPRASPSVHTWAGFQTNAQSSPWSPTQENLRQCCPSHGKSEVWKGGLRGV